MEQDALLAQPLQQNFQPAVIWRRLFPMAASICGWACFIALSQAMDMVL